MTKKFFPNKIALITLVAACFVVNVSMGVRQTFGLFSNNFEVDCGISNTQFGLAVALHSLIWGIFTPIFGGELTKLEKVLKNMVSTPYSVLTGITSRVKRVYN